MEMFSLGTTPADLDRDAPESLHSQISDSLRAMIASGQWPEKYRLKAEPDLARELGVSRGTLRRALQTLTEDGILTQVHGRGTFVSDARPAAPASQKLSTLSEDFASQGIPLHTSVISSALVTAPPSVAKALKIPRGHEVFLLVRVRGTDDHAVALLHNYVPIGVAPGIESVDFAEVPLFSVLVSASKSTRLGAHSRRSVRMPPSPTDSRSPRGRQCSCCSSSPFSPMAGPSSTRTSGSTARNCASPPTSPAAEVTNARSSAP
jgi:DNA-binding GntR family transcriptional regulator